MASLPQFKTQFAVPMTSESCVKEISDSLSRLSGIQNVDANLAKQVVFVEGTAAPSAIVAAIQSTGRDAILRGSGDANSAAVCVLESHEYKSTTKVKGLARMVQVAPELTIIDLTVKDLSQGKYWITVRETGNVSRGALSTGCIWNGSRSATLRSPAPRGALGSVEIGLSGQGSLFWAKHVGIGDVVGRSMVVSRQHDGEGRFGLNGGDTLVGVIARSGGVWENEKTVCSCSGKTLWEERGEERKKGMI